MIEVIDLGDLHGRRKALDHSPEKPHRMGFHMLIYIEEGKGAHFLDFTRRQYVSGSFIFISKNQINAFDLSNRPQGKAILFTDDFVNRIQESMEMPVFSPVYLDNNYSPVFRPSKSVQHSSKNLLSEIEKEIQHGTPNSLVVMFLFSSLFLIIERERGKALKRVSGKNRNKKVEHFIELLENQFTQSRNASEYADQLHITYKPIKISRKKS
ncbi:MAG: hypothetical protein HOM14_00370 [Gammaproteobacteria bacterium]|nr:hypothetical protein [Gammaproteobacteria bacterium]